MGSFSSSGGRSSQARPSDLDSSSTSRPSPSSRRRPPTASEPLQLLASPSAAAASAAGSVVEAGGRRRGSEAASRDSLSSSFAFSSPPISDAARGLDSSGGGGGFPAGPRAEFSGCRGAWVECGGPRCESIAASRRSSGVGNLGRRRISSSSPPPLAMCIRFCPEKPSGSAAASSGPRRATAPVGCFVFFGLAGSFPPNKSCMFKAS